MASAIVVRRSKNADGTDANKVVIEMADVPVKDNLSALQALVGGYIERACTLVFPSKHRADVWVNEEGAINGENPLPTCFIKHPQTFQDMPLYGPVVLVRGKGLTSADMASVCLLRSIDDTSDFPDIPVLRLGRGLSGASL